MVSVNFKTIKPLGSFPLTFVSDSAESFTGSVDEHGPDPARKGIKIAQYVKFCQDSISSAENCRVPVIAAMHGYCFGAAIDLASACDIRLVTKDAKMAIREIEIGTVADFGTLQRFGRKVGNSSWFRELAYSARIFTPEEAKKHGFVNEVYEDQESLYKAAYELAKVIASKSPVPTVGTKITMNYALDHSVEDGLNQVKTMNSALLQSGDLMVAGMASLAKQTPSFSKL